MKQAADLIRPLIPLALCLLSACGFDAFFLDVGILPGARENAVARCCACLASTEAAWSTDAGGTEALESCGADVSTDAGSEATERNCICGASQGECAESLLAGQRISLHGVCTQPDGICGEDCENVLAYPD